VVVVAFHYCGSSTNAVIVVNYRCGSDVLLLLLLL